MSAIQHGYPKKGEGCADPSKGPKEGEGGKKGNTGRTTKEELDNGQGGGIREKVTESGKP